MNRATYATILMIVGTLTFAACGDDEAEQGPQTTLQCGSEQKERAPYGCTTNNGVHECVCGSESPRKQTACCDLEDKSIPCASEQSCHVVCAFCAD